MVAKDTISSIVVFLFSLGAFVLAQGYGGGAELFPRGLAIIMMLASAGMFVRAIFWPAAIPEGVPKMERSERNVVAFCVIATMAYVALIVPLGFATASVIFIIVISYALGMRNHLAIWVTAIGFVGLLYFLFVHIFHTPLPSDLILGLLGI